MRALMMLFRSVHSTKRCSMIRKDFSGRTDAYGHAGAEMPVLSGNLIPQPSLVECLTRTAILPSYHQK